MPAISLVGSSASRHDIAHVRLGRMPYSDAWEVQRKARDLRLENRIGDLVFTVEHDPVFTCGRTARAESFKVPIESIREAGIAIHHVERGGDVTYHGPGQVVVYPIVDLRRYGRDIKAYIHRLEEAAIRVLQAEGIDAKRRTEHPGVWVGERKIGSVGVHVRQWITMHGIALNVDVNADHFALIDPCGLPITAASMREILQRSVAWRDVENSLIAEMARVFGWTIHERSLASILEGARV